MMTEQEFEALWQRAEAAPHAERLTQEYGPWLRRRRRTAGILAAVAVMAMAALPLMRPAAPQGYDHVYCNNTGTADEQWVALADELLMS